MAPKKNSFCSTKAMQTNENEQQQQPSEEEEVENIIHESRDEAEDEDEGCPSKKARTDFTLEQEEELVQWYQEHSIM